jgi:hypothetical protein
MKRDLRFIIANPRHLKCNMAISYPDIYPLARLNMVDAATYRIGSCRWR